MTQEATPKHGYRSLLRRSGAAIATGALFALVGGALVGTHLMLGVGWAESPPHTGYLGSFIFVTFPGAAIGLSLIVLLAGVIVDCLSWSYRTAIVAPATYAISLVAYSFTGDWALISWSDVILWSLPLLCLIIWGVFRVLYWPRHQTI